MRALTLSEGTCFADLRARMAAIGMEGWALALFEAAVVLNPRIEGGRFAYLRAVDRGDFWGELFNKVLAGIAPGSKFKGRSCDTNDCSAPNQHDATCGSMRSEMINDKRCCDDASVIEKNSSLRYSVSRQLNAHFEVCAFTMGQPSTRVIFDVGSIPPGLWEVRSLTGKSGHLSLMRHVIVSCVREEHLLFVGFDENDVPMKRRLMENLFRCSSRVVRHEAICSGILRRLEHAAAIEAATVEQRSSEQNMKNCDMAREWLLAWADDQVEEMDAALADGKLEIAALRQQLHLPCDIDTRYKFRASIHEIEQQQRRQRRVGIETFDAVMNARDHLIASLESRLEQRVESERLFTIRWTVE